MKKVHVISLMLLMMQAGYCRQVQTPLAIHYTGIGVYSQHFSNAFSGSVNQASLAQITQPSAGVYSERRFMLKELSQYTAAINIPSKMGGFGVALAYFGGSDFNSSALGLGYGKRLGSKINIGIQFNYNMIRLAGYGSSSAITVEAGTILHLTDKITMGLHVYNPAGGRFGSTGNEKLAAVYTSGLGYDVSDKLFTSAEIIKEENQPVSINACMQYVFAEGLFARMGIVTGTGNYFFGLGVKWKTCRIDAVSTWHIQLGLTPGIMLLFDFKKGTQKEASEN